MSKRISCSLVVNKEVCEDGFNTKESLLDYSVCIQNLKYTEGEESVVVLNIAGYTIDMVEIEKAYNDMRYLQDELDRG